jgi:hypothetical protein
MNLITICTPIQRNDSKWRDEFKIQGRYYPMLKFSHLSCTNPLNIRGVPNRELIRYNKNICYNFFPKSSNSTVRIYNQRYNFTVFTGFYSIIGLKNEKKINTNINLSTKDLNYTLFADYDILVLGVVDKVYAKNLIGNYSFYNSFTLNSKRITLLVSNQVSKNEFYCKSVYNSTLRKHILKFLKTSELEGIKIKVVPHEYLNQFIDSKDGVFLKTNSLTKIREIETDVKNAFFSNFNLETIE